MADIIRMAGIPSIERVSRMDTVDSNIPFFREDGAAESVLFESSGEAARSRLLANVSVKPHVN